MAELTEAQVELVYDVLCTEAGASIALSDFKAHWPACNEFRFMGTLGFGGKVWSGRGTRPPYVTCYPEDRTPERDQTISVVNQKLSHKEYADA